MNELDITEQVAKLKGEAAAEVSTLEAAPEALATKEKPILAAARGWLIGVGAAGFGVGFLLGHFLK